MSVLDGLYIGGLVAVGLGLLLGLLGGPIGLLVVRAGVVSMAASVFLPVLVAVVLGVLAITRRTGTSSQQATSTGGGTQHRTRQGSRGQHRRTRRRDRLDLDTDSIEDYRR